MEEILEGEEIIVLRAFWGDDRKNYDGQLGVFVRYMTSNFFLVRVGNEDIIASVVCKPTELLKVLV